MNVAFLLHLYQPPTQSETVVKQIFSSSYFPLLKLIKNNSDSKFTINTPLSFLENMDRCGHVSWIKDIKDLVEAERVEIVGSAAYHPLLTKIPEKYIYEQIILNEYALGYYFGSKHGFEGEPSILIKNIRGFFPPEMALNDELLTVLSGLGYEWVMADKCAIPNQEQGRYSESVFRYRDVNTCVVMRDTALSNSLSFKRDAECDDIYNDIMTKLQTTGSAVIALDGEVFGHHNENGIYLLDSLIEKLEGAGAKLVTVSELVEGSTKSKTDTLAESNWSEKTCTTEPDELYKLWDSGKNKTQKALWELQKSLLEKYDKVRRTEGDSGYENIPLWDFKSFSGLPKPLQNSIELNLLVNKSLHSDQFWWASGETLYDKVLFSRTMVSAALDIYKEIAARIDDKAFIKLVFDKGSAVEKYLEQSSL